MCWFATDLQYPESSTQRRGTLGKEGDNTLQRVGEVGGEVIMVRSVSSFFPFGSRYGGGSRMGEGQGVELI